MRMDERYSIKLCVGIYDEESDETYGYSDLEELKRDYPEGKWTFGYHIIDEDIGDIAEDSLYFYDDLNDAYNDYKKIKDMNEMIEIKVVYEEVAKIYKTYNISKMQYAALKQDDMSKFERERLLNFILGDEYNPKEIVRDLQKDLEPCYDIEITEISSEK